MPRCILEVLNPGAVLETKITISTSTTTTTMSELSFKGHTVVITGAGGGLGKAYVVHCRVKEIAWNK